MKAVLVSVVVFCLVASAFAQDGEQAPAAAAVPAPVQTQTIVHTDPAVTNSLNELLQTSRGQTESLRNDLKSAVSALGEQAGQSASALKQQQEKLQELAQAVQQQAAAGAELKNSLSTLHESVSSLQQQLREQSQSQTESKAASASSKSDSRLAKIEDNISTIKEFLGVIANAVTKESDRAATLAANVASNHNVTQTLIKDIIQRIQNSTANNGGSFTDTFKGLYARACDLYRVHVHPYTKDVFGKAAELGSQVADWSKKNGVDFVQNAPKKAQKLQKKALKQYTQTHEQFAQLIVDNGFPKENSQLAAHVALVSGLLLALTLVLVVIRLILSALCGMCCRCSRSKQTAAASPAPAPAPSAQADKSTEQSPKDAAGKNQRPAKPASHRS